MAGQLALDNRWTSSVPRRSLPRGAQEPVVCARCRAKEARYGFRDEERDDPVIDLVRTLCFECFRAEIGRRQAVAARLSRGWNATQANLPLEKRLEALGLRRRRALIAARREVEEVEKWKSGKASG
jgi:hypothetical protein